MSDYNNKEDKRMMCKYGIRCHQKNPLHHQKYKHPPKRPAMKANLPVTKKIKLDDTISSTKQPSVSNNISDSEEETPTNRNENKSDVVKTTEKKNDPSVSNNISDSEEDTPTNRNKENNSEEKKLEVVKETKKAAQTFTPMKFNCKEFIKTKFLVDMPDDFYKFWELCKKIKESNPSKALQDVGIILVGPFDVLAGKFNNIPEKSDNEYLIHWRYYHDPPELQTVLKVDESKGYHIGYFRDDPNENPVYLVSNYANVDGTLEIMGSNIFASVYNYLEDLKKSADPFKKVKVCKFQNTIKAEADRLKLEISKKGAKVRGRENKVVARTLNKIGLVVPIDKKTDLGYRELTLDDKKLKTVLHQLETALEEQVSKYLEVLQPVFTYASIATDECDFGTGIELGWDLIFHKIDTLNGTAARFLSNSYQLLNRNAFAKIAVAHMENRKKGTRLSILY